MIISPKGLNEEYRGAIAEMGREFSLRFSEDGIPVTVCESETLTAKYDGKALQIGCERGKGFFRALSIAAAMPPNKPFCIEEPYTLDRLGLMVDCSRGAVPKPETVKKLIRYMAALGYNTLQLYLEDIFEVEGEPFFGYLRGRYSRTELRDLDGYAASFGIELIPCVQTLAHFTAPARWQQFTEGKFDLDDILLVGEEKTYEFIEKIFAAMRSCFRSKNINIGMDEAHRLGLGKYLEKHGYENRFDILCRHLQRVSAIAEKYGFQPMMWSDMFFRLAFHGEYYAHGGSVPPEVCEKVPKNVKLIYWNYYSIDEAHYDDMFRAHKEFPVPVVFAGGLWKWIGFTPHNGFSIKATAAALNSAKRQGIKEAFFTMWGDNGAECPLFSLLPSVVFAAESVYGHGAEVEWISRRFKALTGMTYSDFMAIDLPDILEDDPHDLKCPSKYLLYNDCLMGIFDCTTDEQDSRLYAEYAEKLQRLVRHKKWGYLFESASALCRVLALKANLGNRTHEAYLAKDKAALSEIEHDYGTILRELRKFEARFRRQWNVENKPQGLEINETRLGGLYGRIEGCRKTLCEYLAGKIDCIPELEEQLLDLSGDREFYHRHVTYNGWSTTFTGGVS